MGTNLLPHLCQGIKIDAFGQVANADTVGAPLRLCRTASFYGSRPCMLVFSRRFASSMGSCFAGLCRHHRKLFGRYSLGACHARHPGARSILGFVCLGGHAISFGLGGIASANGDGLMGPGRFAVGVLWGGLARLPAPRCPKLVAYACRLDASCISVLRDRGLGFVDFHVL